MQDSEGGWSQPPPAEPDRAYAERQRVVREIIERSRAQQN